MTFRVTRARLAVLLLACAAAWPAQAQSPSDNRSSSQPVSSLQETVVTATRNTQLLSAAVPHTTLISREDIERSQASDLVSLLQREAGLQQTQNGGTGTVSSVFMRGAPSLQTLVLIDGVPLNKQDATGAISLEHVMLDNVERVEIVRGNVSAIYGSGAIGGVIQIFTRDGGQRPSTRLGLDVGSRDTVRWSAQSSHRIGDTDISAGISRHLTGGFSAVNPGQQPGANPDDDGYQNTSANVSVVHRLADRHRVGMRFMRSTGATDYDNPFGAPVDVQHSTTRLQQTSLFTDNTWGDWRSRLTLSQQSDRSFTSDNGAWGSDDHFRTQATVLNWTNNLPLGDDWLLTAGLERQWQRAQTGSNVYAAYDARRQTTAVFAGVEGAVGPGAVQLNLRHDRVGDLAKSTGYLGYSWPLSDRVKLIASTSTAFNAPPLGYLYAPSYGNPNLASEQARSHELGVQFQQAAHLLRMTWFDTRVSNQLDYDTALYRFQNIGRTRNQGLELSYQGLVRQTRLRASLTLQDPKNDLTGETLLRRAKTSWSVGVSQPWGRWRVDADLRHNGRRSDRYTDASTFATVNTTLAAYSVLDLAVSYPLRRDLELRARIENVTDRAYQTVYGYHQPPRSFQVGLVWRPGF